MTKYHVSSSSAARANNEKIAANWTTTTAQVVLVGKRYHYHSPNANLTQIRLVSGKAKRIGKRERAERAKSGEKEIEKEIREWKKK